eukprot:NODE_2057_length_997_cov_100.150844_g1679_i0.p3 GENE.NODE_2057_length_997_cov_100.150844_g1679_i0~~NODE_2057_length_997_cov_100.150844_g1679_i0.p3  ORF type:complete len:101 (-),score=6.74 NODE_2057_length_997_cov_100.150844_g1679_i0:530-832(-)
MKRLHRMFNHPMHLGLRRTPKKSNQTSFGHTWAGPPPHTHLLSPSARSGYKLLYHGTEGGNIDHIQKRNFHTGETWREWWQEMNGSWKRKLDDGWFGNGI